MATTTAGTEGKKPSDLIYANLALIPFLLVLVLVIVARYWSKGDAQAVALMWAGACLISGAVIGFLFGIPRVIQSDGESGAAAKTPAGASRPAAEGVKKAAETATYRQLVNTNLVEISDWLTKIIVGLGLVNLEKVPALVQSSAAVLSADLTEKSYAFATALIVAFSVLGFLMGYLYTRLFLAGAFYRAESAAGELRDTVDRIVSQETSAAGTPIDRSLPVTDSEIQAAKRISALPEARDLASTVGVLKDLAREYDEARREMSSGTARTAKMEGLIRRMRALALAGFDALPSFANSVSAGERLVAIAMLEVKPDPGYVEWLLDRILVERPFLVYHALEALRRTAESFDQNERRRIKELLERKVLSTEKGKELLNSDTDRAALLKLVQEMVSR